MSIIQKKALVFEPCPYHYTLLGPYAYYLSTLGYEVTLLVHESCNPKIELYDAMQFVSEVRHFKGPQWRDAKESLFSCNFDLIWITTINVPLAVEGKRLFDALEGYPQPKDGLFGTLHDINLIEENHIMIDKFARIFTLANHKDVLFNSAPISLSYYEKPCLGKKLSFPISLLAVGISVSLCGAMNHIAKDKNRNDYSVSFVGKKTKLRFWTAPLYARLTSKRHNMEADQLGSYPTNPLRLIRASRKLHVLGEVDSEAMYSLVSKSDYLIANFEGQMLDIFSKDRVSGIALLSLGFNVPMLINETIAESWGFDSDNAIVFPDGRFDLALAKMAKVEPEEYRTIQASLLNKQNNDLKQSLEAIKLAIEEWKASCSSRSS